MKTIGVPSDKSISHRAAIMAAMAEKPVEIRNYLTAADCMSTLGCLEALGAEILRAGDKVLIKGGLKNPSGVLDAGNSGTTVRLMTGLLAGLNISARFIGDASLSRRPMNRIIKPLRLMGADISAEDGHLPLEIRPSGRLRGISYEMPVASAQVKSAILLAGMNALSPTTITEPIRSRDHTERMLKSFGAQIEIRGREIKIYPSKLEVPEAIEIPNDISSAAYWLVWATCSTGAEILLKNIGVNETRTGLLDALIKMGASIELLNRREICGEPTADIRVKSARLSGILVTAEEIPRLIDEIPILAVAAAFADGISVIEGTSELKIKESDRLAGILNEFNKIMPGGFEALGDTLIIKPQPAPTFAECKTYGDHRLAMALAIFGRLARGVVLDDTDCVKISYPNFFNQLLKI